MINKVYQEDCMTLMSKYPSKYFDLGIVDPPFFSGPNKRRFYGKEVNNLNIRRTDYDVIPEWEIPDQKYYDELCRVTKNQIIFGINYFDFKNVPAGRIIWDKCNDSSDFSDAEIASCSMINSVRIFRYMWNGMQQGKSALEGHIMQGNKALNEKRIHPCHKPIALYQWILSKYAKPGDKILDTHVSGGSIRIACHEYGFDFTGAEINPIIWEKQERRFQPYLKKLKFDFHD